MSQEEEVRQALREALKTRGFQTKLAEELGVTATTVMRWDKGGDIPPPMLKLLEWYFFAIVPPRLSRPTTDLRGVLEFDEAEWRMITIMAARDGNKEPGKWIASRIRDYLALQMAASDPARHAIAAVPDIEPALRSQLNEPKQRSR